jgi:hypothetical protein
VIVLELVNRQIYKRNGEEINTRYLNFELKNFPQVSYIRNTSLDTMANLGKISQMENKQGYIFRTYDIDGFDDVSGYWLLAYDKEEIYVELLGKHLRKTIGKNQYAHYWAAKGQKYETNEDLMWKMLRNKMMLETLGGVVHDTRKEKLFDWQTIDTPALVKKIDTFRQDFLGAYKKNWYWVCPDFTVQLWQNNSRNHIKYECYELELSLKFREDFMTKLMKLHTTGRAVHIIINDMVNLEEFLESGMNIDEWLKSDDCSLSDRAFDRALDWIDEFHTAQDLWGNQFIKRFNKLTICRLSEYLSKGEKARFVY